MIRLNKYKLYIIKIFSMLLALLIVVSVGCNAKQSHKSQKESMVSNTDDLG